MKTTTQSIKEVNAVSKHKKKKKKPTSNTKKRSRKNQRILLVLNGETIRETIL